MTLILQITGVVFAFAMIYFTYIHFKRKEFFFRDMLIWTIAWIGFIIVLIVPQSLNFLFESFSIQGALWFITIFAIIFLTGLVFYLHYTVRKCERKVELVVKKVALMNSESEHKRK